jgi:glutaredoxin 3
MARVEIYTKFLCPFCSRALALLEGKGVDFDEINITTNATRRQEMITRASGRTTVPQIFINGDHIGGCDDLVALNGRGALDPMLAS